MFGRGRLATAVLAGVLILVAVLGALLSGVQRQRAEGQGATTMAVDADMAGNLAASIDKVDDCVILHLGESATVDVVILDVEGILGFEFQFEYDPSIVEIQDVDSKLLIASAAGSRVIDVSEPLPDPDSLHLFGAADIGRGAPLESGSGVLARVTLGTKAAGVSPLSIPKIDVNDDGKIDLGPRLIGAGGSFIGDQGGDQFFDGPLLEAHVAVDSDCPPPPSTPTPPPSDQATPPAGSTPEASSTPSGDETVLLPPVPQEISDSMPPGRAVSGDAGGSSDGSGTGPSGGGDSASGESGSSSSSSGGLVLWLGVIFASVMLISGVFIIVRALLVRR